MLFTETNKINNGLSSFLVFLSAVDEAFCDKFLWLYNKTGKKCRSLYLVYSKDEQPKNQAV